jgi:hypothetical protein
MKRILYFSIELIAILLFFTNHIICQENEKFSELKNLIKEWTVKSVFPEVQLFKKDVERILSDNDLEELKKLQSRAKELKKELLNKRISALEGMRDGNRSLYEASRESFSSIRKKQGELLKDLQKLITPYSDKIKTIAEKHKSEMKALKEEVKKIGKDWYEKNKSNLTDKEKAFIKYRMLKKADDIKFIAMKKKMRLAKILLLDGETEIFN